MGFVMVRGSRRHVWEKLALIALAGAVGTLARYWLGAVVPRWLGTGFPWETLVVNALGCFLFGFVWTLAEDDRLLISGQTRQILLIGFMGAFTTFSTFAFETGQQLRDNQWWYAAGNMAAELGLGLVCLFLGFALGRLV
jgi:CrcB protein